MNLRKYKHACLVLTKGDENLVLDPGSLSTDFVVPENVSVVIVTHEHEDHFYPLNLDAIFTKNTDAILVAPRAVLDKYETPHKKPALVGSTVTIGEFTLEFFGGKHALIHEKVPICDNIGVLINDTLYYPGDSFALPGKPAKILGVPLSGPWSKLSESVDFLRTVHPEQAFSTHDAHLSEDGKELIDRLVPMLTSDLDIIYSRLDYPIEV